MPQAPEGVIDALQASVRMHMTAMEHYQSQAEHFDRWGYGKLADAGRYEVEEERRHLHEVQARLEYYDVQPAFDHDQPDWPRHDFEGILAANLALEMAAAETERANVAACRAVGDEVTAVIFTQLLEGSEEAVAAIEAKQRVIEQIGLDNYLANQVTA
jgi:bacterioferritin